VLALAAWLCAAAAGHAAAAVLTLDRADMLVSASEQVPAADAAWQPVVLPHAWFRDRPSGGNVVWYRIGFELAERPAATQMIFLRRANVWSMDLHLNGRPFVAHTDFAARGASVSGLQLRVPADRLHAGRNEFHVRVAASPDWLQGMTRVQLGPMAEIRNWGNAWRLLQVDVIVLSGFGFGLVGVLALFLWSADRDEAMLWYGGIGTAFGLVTLAWYLTQQDAGPQLRRQLVYLRFFLPFAPLIVLQLRVGGRRWRVAEGGVWSLLVAAAALMYASGPWHPYVWSLSMAVFPTLLLASSVMLLRPRDPGPAMQRLLLALAGVASAGFALHDTLVRTGYLEFDRAWLHYYVVPLYMTVAGAAIFERYVAGVRRLRASHAELEARIGAKSREIDRAYREREAREREGALAAERRRIMADMHDVLGSRLVGLLSLVQSGNAPRAKLEEEIAASVDELRMTIDSVQPVEGDLGVVLGNVRHRMRSLFGATGTELDWRVGELPPMAELTPARVLAIQRLLLEVFTNVLKHSGARLVRVSTAVDDGSARILIEDNGRGFDDRRREGGHGLVNLAARAADAGGTVAVSTVPGGGTRVTLALPLGASKT